MAEPTIAKAKPRSTTTLTRACAACRMSKVKCTLDAEETPGSVCQRCVRLGLHCIFEESKRGRGVGKLRDIARLGPSVRALLRAQEPAQTSDPQTTKNEPLHLGMNPEDECSLLAWRGNECQRMMVQSIGSREGQVALLKHWFRIGMASGHCGLLGNILILAHKCQISLDDFRLPVPLGNVIVGGGSSPPAVAPPPSPPPYIAEWLADPTRLSCMRVQHDGAVHWHPNDAFVRSVGDEASLRQRLEAEQGLGLADEPDYLICAAEVFLAAPLHKTDQRCLARLNGVLWTAVSEPHALHAATGIRSAEAVAPVDVRCALRQPPAAAASSIEESFGGATTLYTPCRLSGRTLVYPDSSTVYSVFSLSNPAAHVRLGDAEAAEAAAAEAPRDVGFEAWPLHELQITGAAVGAAHGMGMKEDEDSISYEALEDLGLSFDPADLAEIIAGGSGDEERAPAAESI